MVLHTQVGGKNYLVLLWTLGIRFCPGRMLVLSSGVGGVYVARLALLRGKFQTSYVRVACVRGREQEHMGQGGVVMTGVFRCVCVLLLLLLPLLCTYIRAYTRIRVLCIGVLVGGVTVPLRLPVGVSEVRRADRFRGVACSLGSRYPRAARVRLG